MSKRALEHLRADPALGKLIEHFGPPGLQPRRLPPVQSLIQAIIHQQLSGKAAGAILARFQGLFDGSGFPAPEQIVALPKETLLSAGLSRAKCRYILGIAQRHLDGSIPSLDDCDRMSDEELIETLTQANGVGRWTAEMLLIFNLGRPDVLPVHDLGVRRGFQVAYRKRRLPTPEQLAIYGRRWAPYRTTAAWYLWRAADLLNGAEW